MDMSLIGIRSGKNWLIAGFLALWLSILTGLISYITLPPTTLFGATGRVVSVNYPNRKPKVIIFVDDGHEVLHIYTDLGVLQSNVVAGDVVEVKFARDVFGRNFHRIWDLRRGDEALLSKAKSFPEAEAVARQIGWLAFLGFAVSSAVLAIGVSFQTRSRAAP